MAEVEACTTREQLEQILARGPFPATLVSVDKYGGLDKRIGWDTYIVMGTFIMDGSGPCPLGFTNGPLP